MLKRDPVQKVLSKIQGLVFPAVVKGFICVSHRRMNNL